MRPRKQGSSKEIRAKETLEALLKCQVILDWLSVQFKKEALGRELGALCAEMGLTEKAASLKGDGSGGSLLLGGPQMMASVGHLYGTVNFL